MVAAAVADEDAEDAAHSKLTTTSATVATGGKPVTVTATAVPAAFAAADDGEALVTAGAGGVR
jgi:hypothetical protein